MKKIQIFALLSIFVLAAAAYAYVPENTEENSFENRIVIPYYDVTGLIGDGIKAIRQEEVSSSYDQERSTKLSGGELTEKESGEESVTSKEVIYYEPKEEIYEAQEILDEIQIWISMYRTTHGDDVVAFNKHLKKYIGLKDKYLGKLIKALKYEKDNKDSVLKYRRNIEKIDKYFKRHMKRLKGKIVLIEGKPLPEPEFDLEEELED